MPLIFLSPLSRPSGEFVARPDPDKDVSACLRHSTGSGLMSEKVEVVYTCIVHDSRRRQSVRLIAYIKRVAHTSFL